MSATVRSAQVVIVGGGISGIACARTLQARGIDFLLVEGSSSLGGRIQSDHENGYTFDRGFQVFNSAYEKTRELLQGTGIQFRNLPSGALVKTDSGFSPLCDPLREPRYLLSTLFSPVGDILDRFRMLKLRSDVIGGRVTLGRTTLEELESRGFSQSMIEQFFKPFLGGVFLEGGLQTCSETFEAVFRNFSVGGAQLPLGGMGELSRAMAKPLIKSRILLGQRATVMTKNLVKLESGSEIIAENVVSALDVNSLRQLRPDIQGLPRMHSVSNLYFATKEKLPIGRFLVLNGTGSGEINNLISLSEGGYAPAGSTLLSVSVLGSACNQDTIIKELQGWFPGVTFQFLRSYTVGAALPEQYSPRYIEPEVPLDIALCGDFLSPASIEGAVRSGVAVGERLCR